MHCLSYIFIFSSIYYHFISKSRVSALALIISMVLMLLTNLAYCFLNSKHNKVGKTLLVIGCMLIVTALGAGLWQYGGMNRFPRQLFYAAAPLLGYLLTFCLQFFAGDEKNTEKTSAEG